MEHTVGIIGLGMIGEKVLAEFLNHPAFTVTAAWDLSLDICDRVKANHPDAPIVDYAEQVFSTPDTELFYIATPPVTHVSYGLKVIEMGKALFMEKPLSLDINDSQQLVEGAEKRHILTAMNFAFGSGPIVEALQDALSRKFLGKILSIEVRYQYPSWPLPNQLSAASWITNRKTGGMLREMFSHHVYLIHRLLGPLNIIATEFNYPPEKIGLVVEHRPLIREIISSSTAMSNWLTTGRLPVINKGKRCLTTHFRSVVFVYSC